MKTSPIIRLFVMGVILVALNVPLTMMCGVVGERTARRNQVAAEVSESWGGAQTVGGPVLTVPYDHVDRRRGPARERDHVLQLSAPRHRARDRLELERSAAAIRPRLVAHRSLRLASPGAGSRDDGPSGPIPTPSSSMSRSRARASSASCRQATKPWSTSRRPGLIRALSGPPPIRHASTRAALLPPGACRPSGAVSPRNGRGMTPSSPTRSPARPPPRHSASHWFSPWTSTCKPIGR